jgi:hypothetical protein
MNEVAFYGLLLTGSLAAVAHYAAWSRVETSSRGMTVLAFVCAAFAVYFAMQRPLGYPDTDALPEGEFTVLGAKIEVDVAIYAMLDDGKGEPHLYRLPYSAGEADKLQQAIDATAGGQAGGVKARSDDQGSPEFYSEPVREDAPKVTEQPMVTQ